MSTIMQLFTMLLTITLALSTQALATHTKSHSTKSHYSTSTISLSTSTTPPPPNNSYAHGFPLCAIPGFTVVPGNYTETIQQSSGSDLKCCLDQCRDDMGAPATNNGSARGECMSIAFHARYTECLFFDRVVEETQLDVDEESEFVHFDLECEVE